MRFIDGRAGKQVAIAFPPGSLGAHIRTLETSVSLRLDYARKLLLHGMKYEGFDYIQETIDNGMCLIDDEYRLRFLYVKDSIKPEIYFLLLKTDRTRKEVWLVTFHKLRKKQFEDRIERDKIIREHVERDFMG